MTASFLLVKNSHSNITNKYTGMYSFPNKSNLGFEWKWCKMRNMNIVVIYVLLENYFCFTWTKCETCISEDVTILTIFNSHVYMHIAPFMDQYWILLSYSLLLRLNFANLNFKPFIKYIKWEIPNN